MADSGGRAVKPRGLTLVEVIAAVVLMATLAVAIVPMLQASASISGRATPAADLVRLGAFADQLFADPRTFGLTDEALANGPLDTLIPFPGGAPVRLTRLEPTRASSDHSWLSLESDGAAVVRWVYDDRNARP